VGQIPQKIILPPETGTQVLIATKNNKKPTPSIEGCELAIG